MKMRYCFSNYFIIFYKFCKCVFNFIFFRFVMFIKSVEFIYQVILFIKLRYEMKYVVVGV